MNPRHLHPKEMTDEKEQTVVRAILRNEITWVITLIVGIWAFTTTVVLPLQALQINVAKIQESLLAIDGKYVQWEGRLGKVEIDIARLKEKHAQ